MEASELINNSCRNCYKRKITPHIDTVGIDNLLINIRNSNINSRKQNIFIVDNSISNHHLVNSENSNPSHFTVITTEEFRRTNRSNMQYYPNFHFSANSIYCNIISIHEISPSQYCLYTVFTKNGRDITTNNDAIINDIFKFSLIISDTIYKNTYPKYDICIIPVLHNSNSVNINNIEPLLYFEQFKRLSAPSLKRQNTDEAKLQYLYNTSRAIPDEYISNTRRRMESTPKLFRHLSKSTSPKRNSERRRHSKRSRSNSDSYSGRRQSPKRRRTSGRRSRSRSNSDSYSGRRPSSPKRRRT
jgi:hypothetical protein